MFLLAYESHDFTSSNIISTNFSGSALAFSLDCSQVAICMQRLYNLGARKIVMFEIGPVGCIPSMTRKHEHNGRCVEDINQIVSFFNRRLPSLLKNLTSSLRGSTFVLGKANSLGHDAITHPCKYGISMTFLFLLSGYFHRIARQYT